MSDEHKQFWTSLPGILTGVAAVVTSVTGLVIAFKGGEFKEAQAKTEAEIVAPAQPTAPPKPVAHALDASATTAATATTAAQAAGDEIYTLKAVIQDADGFTNVRAARSPKSDVLAVINKNEEFFTYRQDTKWWRVKTRDGVVGYMHISRIHLLEQ